MVNPSESSSTETALRRLANRVVWPGFQGHELPSWAEDALQDGLAGLVYFDQNIADAEHVGALSNRIHQLNPLALIGADEEGGIVTRLEAREGSSTPGNAVLGRVDDVALTQAAAAWTGALVASAGIDIDLAPTVDVNVDPRNPVIGVRAFGASAELVSRHTEAAVRGLQSAGIAACAKHFPGHGDTSTDSHLALAVTNASPDEMADVHLAPFARAIEAGVKTVMTAHIRVPHLGEEPATVNGRALRILRDMGFGGVIISDALDMAAIRHTIGMGAGAVRALAAGVDLLCIGNPSGNPPHPKGRTDEMEFLEVRDAIVEALRSGELSRARVEEAAERVGELARWVRSRSGPSAPSEPIDWVTVARDALRVDGRPVLGSGTITLVDARTKRNSAAGPQPDHFTRALSTYRDVDRVWLADAADIAEATERASAALESASAPVLVVNQVQSNDMEAAVLEAVLRRRPDTVVIAGGWPEDDGAHPSGPGRWTEDAAIVYAFGSGAVNAQAVAGLLCRSR